MNDNMDIRIIKSYDMHKKVGKGAYGQVWKCTNKKTNSICALKRIFDAFRNLTDCQRTYREIMYLQQLSHPNVVQLYNYEKSGNQRDMYIEMEFIESDLATALKNGYLKDLQKQYIFAQLVAAVHYLHSGNLIHRDIKPSNILVGANCQAKLCDFGLIRAMPSKLSNYDAYNGKLTDNIATRWYKAPELLLNSCNYGKQIDIWSLGCLLAELYLGKPLFQGTSTFSQLQKIIQITGVPAVDTLTPIIQSETSITVLHSFINDHTNAYGQLSKKDSSTSIQASTGKSKSTSSESGNRSIKSSYNKLLNIIPELQNFQSYNGNVVLDLLEKLLQFDPRKRLSIEQIVDHPFLNKFRNKIELKKIIKPIKIKYDNGTNNNYTRLTIEDYKLLLSNDNKYKYSDLEELRYKYKQLEKSKPQQREVERSCDKDPFANANLARGADNSGSKRKISITNKFNTVPNITSQIAQSSSYFRVKNYSPSNSVSGNNMKNSGLGSRQHSESGIHKKYSKEQNNYKPNQNEGSTLGFLQPDQKQKVHETPQNLFVLSPPSQMMTTYIYTTAAGVPTSRNAWQTHNNNNINQEQQGEQDNNRSEKSVSINKSENKSVSGVSVKSGRSNISNISNYKYKILSSAQQEQANRAGTNTRQIDTKSTASIDKISNNNTNNNTQESNTNFTSNYKVQYTSNYKHYTNNSPLMKTNIESTNYTGANSSIAQSRFHTGPIQQVKPKIYKQSINSNEFTSHNVNNVNLSTNSNNNNNNNSSSNVNKTPDSIQTKASIVVGYTPSINSNISNNIDTISPARNKNIAQTNHNTSFHPVRTNTQNNNSMQQPFDYRASIQKKAKIIENLRNHGINQQSAVLTRTANRQSAYPEQPSSPQLVRQQTSINSVSSFSSLNSINDRDVDSSGPLSPHSSQQCRDNIFLNPDIVPLTLPSWQSSSSSKSNQHQFQMYSTPYLPYTNLPRPSLSSASLIPITGQSSPIMPSSPFARSQQNYIPSSSISNNMYLQNKNNTVLYTNNNNNNNIAGRSKWP